MVKFMTFEWIVIPPIVFGNLLIIYSIYRFRMFHTRSYMLIANLAVSDLLVGLIYLPYDILYWNFKWIRQRKAMCILKFVLQHEFVGASVFNLLVISIDRYAAITYPLWRLQLSTKWTKIAIMVSWLASTVIAVVPFATVNSYDASNNCTFRWSMNFPIEYEISTFSVYMLAIIISFVLYSLVARRTFGILKRNEQKGHNSPSVNQYSFRRLISSYETTKIMILVLGVFVLCWLPYGVAVTVDYIAPLGPIGKTAKFIGGMLALLNSALNWIIFGVKNKNIRKSFKIIFCKKKYTERQLNRAGT